MLVEIVFTGLPIDRDEVEEALDAAFGPDGEITAAAWDAATSTFKSRRARTRPGTGPAARRAG